MENSQFLAQAIGLFMTIVGLVFLFRSDYFIEKFKSFFKNNHQLRLILVILELLGGLFLVLGHENNLSPAPVYAKLISLFGWLMIIEGIFNLVVSDEAIEDFYSKFMQKGWFVGFSIVSVLVGVFLWIQGFGLVELGF